MDSGAEARAQYRAKMDAAHETLANARREAVSYPDWSIEEAEKEYSGSAADAMAELVEALMAGAAVGE
jgi:predicted translin family RNA/ssDNA-binding protein